MQAKMWMTIVTIIVNLFHFVVTISIDFVLILKMKRPVRYERRSSGFNVEIIFENIVLKEKWIIMFN